MSGTITTSDSLTTLRTAVGTSTTSCNPCVGLPVSPGPAENVTVTAALACTYACPAEPDPSCVGGMKSSLSILNGTDPANHSIKWQLTKGPQIDQADFGDPTVATTYSLCIYDQSLGVYSLEDELTVLFGANWTDKDPRGFFYQDPFGSFDGVTRIQLKTGAAGKSKFHFRAKGLDVPMPVAFSGSEMFDAESVDVTLHNNSTADCWRSSYGAIRTNTPTKFVAKNP